MTSGVEIDWVKIRGFNGQDYYIGMSGTVRLFAITVTSRGFTLFTDLPGIRDRYEPCPTFEEQKAKARVVFDKWLELAGFGPVVSL